MPLSAQVRTYIYDHSRRANYVAAATDYLRGKRQNLDREYDVVLVGAGMHAAMFLYTARKITPGLRALVVEKSDAISSVFARLGDSLILNSPTSSKVGLNSNIAPGHFVQLSDFDELAERTYPTAKHLHELATMLLFHADADILFGFEVEGIDATSVGYTLSANGQTIACQSVLVANGMGGPRQSFASDRWSERVVGGDEFVASCYDDNEFLDRLRDERIAVVGAGDTANCVMEYLLPLTYPHCQYGSHWNDSFVPAQLYWFGQNATNVKEFYFANKQRYCYSGGVIEFFWDGESPFDLPADAWSRTKSVIRCVPDKLTSLSHREGALTLIAGDECFEVDKVVDCTGRFNSLSSRLLRSDYEFVEGDVALWGGQWDRELDQFVVSPRFLKGRRIACKLKGERVFLLGSACPLSEVIEDEEAMDGSLRHQESRTSITNSKWSLEHTLPRTVAFAEQYARRLTDAESA
ncbi:MAG: hypothetical protein AAGE52_37270 [Myxococcota bacterium]